MGFLLTKALMANIAQLVLPYPVHPTTQARPPASIHRFILSF
uniref:Uncharacterized protein n=1 Tax=CrAss-like virus sp. ctYsL76 TaxID=2826826 RepID=A0A8S5QLS9_9CAUD|nr:MAG TPA: hypothetical protein [CrAss-like virus sp. ctYsL76]